MKTGIMLILAVMMNVSHGQNPISIPDIINYYNNTYNGELVFTSLKPLLSKHNYSFSDIWNIIPVGNAIFFRSKKKIFQYNNNSITVYQVTISEKERLQNKENSSFP